MTPRQKRKRRKALRLGPKPVCKPNSTGYDRRLGTSKGEQGIFMDTRVEILAAKRKEIQKAKYPQFFKGVSLETLMKPLKARG